MSGGNDSANLAMREQEKRMKRAELQSMNWRDYFEDAAAAVIPIVAAGVVGYLIFWWLGATP
jgi:hypothetical protein